MSQVAKMVFSLAGLAPLREILLSSFACLTIPVISRKGAKPAKQS
jgi:hypothetical protein